MRGAASSILSRVIVYNNCIHHGYTSFYQDKIQNKKKGTGVAVYIHESLNAIFDHEHSIIIEHIEAIFVSITNIQNHSK